MGASVISKKDISLKLPPGNYSITAQGKSKFGCVSELSNPVNVTIEAQPIGPKVNCENVTVESLSAQWLPLPGISVFEISLDSGKTWLSSNIAGGMGYNVKGLSYGTNVSFWVRGQTAAPCNYTVISTKQCKTKNCFKANYTLLNDSICANAEKGFVEIKDLKIDKYAISFNKGSYSKSNMFEYSPAFYGQGKHKLEISIVDSNALSCPAYDTIITFQVNPFPNPEILTTWLQFENENRICLSEDPKLLTGNVLENGQAYTNFEWTGNGVRALAGKTFEFSPSTAGIGAHELRYETTNIFGCKNTNSQTVNVDALKKVSFTFSADQRLVSFAASTENTKNVVWDFGNGDISTILEPTYYYNKDGLYTVTLVSDDKSNVCPDVSFQDEINVIGGSIAEVENMVEIYPNPFNEQLVIKSSSADYNKLQIFSADGKLVFDEQ